MKRKATEDHNNRDRKVPRINSLAPPQQQPKSGNELMLPVVISSSQSKGRKKSSEQFSPHLVYHTRLTTCQAYYDKWQRAINDECAAELSQVRERIQTWPLTRLVHEGYTLTDQHVTDLNHVPTLLVKFQYASRAPYPLNHRFNHGDAVLITRNGHAPVTTRTAANNSTNNNSNNNNSNASLLDQGSKPYQWEGVVVERSIRHIWVQYTSGGMHVTSLRALLEEEHATAEQSTGPYTAANNSHKSRGWRIDRGPSTVTFDRMSYALQLFTGQKLTNHVTVRSTWSEESVPYSSVFQQLLMDLQSPAEITRLAAEQPGLWGEISPNSARDIEHVIPEWRTWQLNDSQRSVISHVINRRLALIQGPPGTGKTYTAVHLMKVMTVLAQRQRAKNSTSPLPLLATAFTNVAVDNLLEGLLKLGVRAVRVGRSVKIREELRAVSLEVQMTRDRRYPRLEEITQEIARLETSQRRSVKQRDNSVNAEVDKSLGEKRRELRQMMREIQRDILSRAEVIVGTVVGVGDYELLSRDVKFNVVLMDEASQCSEPALLIPLVRSRDIKQLVLLGDHYQLPPTSIKGNDAVLTISPFQRLAGHASHVIQLDDPLTPSHVPLISPNLLQYQYRMHPDIAHFPSMYFYKGKIFNAVQSSDRPLPAGFPWPVSGAEQHPVVFVNVPQGVEEAGNVGLGKSFMNREEAKYVMTILRCLLAPVTRPPEHVPGPDITYFDDDSGFEMVLDTAAPAAKNSPPQLSTSDIGIITPYSGQVRHISDLISRDKFFTQFRAKLVISPRKSQPNTARDKTARDSTEDEVALVEEGENSQTLVEGGLNVASVDGFQGREKEIIIFSAVRSNPEHRVGFLNDWRRLNVALTRARSGLIVLGHRETLMHDPHWRAWLLFMEKQHWCRSIEELTAPRAEQ